MGSVLNYIHSELYRTFHRRYTFIMWGALALAAAGVNILLFWMKGQGILNSTADNPLNAMSFMPMIVPTMFLFVYYAVCIVVDCAFGDDYKNQTLKNTISYGITRSQIYLGKLISAFLLALATMVVLCAVYFLTAVGFNGTQGSSFMEILQWFGLQLLHIFPIWLAGLCIANFFYFLCKNTTMASFCYMGAILIIPFIIAQYLARAFQWAATITPYLMFDMSQEGAKVLADCAQPWAIGLAWAVLSTVAGLILCQKKEIK